MPAASLDTHMQQQSGDHMAATDSVELRGLCQRETVDILDAVSCARRMTRIDLINEILAAWCVDQVHVATLVYRASRGNPQLTEAVGVRGTRGSGS